MPDPWASPSRGSAVGERLTFPAGDAGRSANSPIVIQRLIKWNGWYWEGTSARPAWRAATDRALLVAYNIQKGVSLEVLDYQKEKLDRCHKISFKELQDKLVSFLNKDIAKADFEGWVRILADADPAGTLYEEISPAFEQLANEVQKGNPSPGSANNLLGILNSLWTNLRAASKYINAYIGQRMDLSFTQSPGGTYHLEPGSRPAAVAGTHPYLLTPENRSRLVTSEGPVPLAQISPRSSSLLQDRPFETRQIHSAKLRQEIYPGGGPAGSSSGAASGTLDLGVDPAPANLGELLYEWERLRENPNRNSTEQARLVELTAFLKNFWPTE